MALMAITLASVAAAFVAIWGVAHAIPTSQVLVGFKPITQDNRRVVLQEWLAEAFTMWGLAGHHRLCHHRWRGGIARQPVDLPRSSGALGCLGCAHKPYRCPHARDLVQDLPRPPDILRGASAGGESDLTNSRSEPSLPDGSDARPQNAGAAGRLSGVVERHFEDTERPATAFRKGTLKGHPRPWRRSAIVALTLLWRRRLRLHVLDHYVWRWACVCGIQLASDHTSNRSVVPDAIAIPYAVGAFH